MFGDHPSLTRAKEVFTYENIAAYSDYLDDSLDDGRSYQFLSTLHEGFYHFSYAGGDAQFKSTTRLKIGWKLQIAVKDTDRERTDEVARAWNCVKDIFIEQRLTEVKVLQARTSLVSQPYEQGKQITIYQCANPNREWKPIVEQLELALRRASIEPDIFGPTNRQIGGSHYLSYRNDMDDKRKYISTEEVVERFADERPEVWYNPFHRLDDPFDFSIRLEETALKL